MSRQDRGPGAPARRGAEFCFELAKSRTRAPTRPRCVLRSLSTLTGLNLGFASDRLKDPESRQAMLRIRVASGPGASFQFTPQVFESVGRTNVSVRRTTPSALTPSMRSLLINWQVNGHA
jgi:hypothetical protein